MRPPRRQCLTGLLLWGWLCSSTTYAAATTLIIAPGEPGQRQDRALVSALVDRLDAGGGSVSVSYLHGRGAADDGLLIDPGLEASDVAQVILLHDAALAAYIEGAEPFAAARVAAYGILEPSHRQWLRRQQVVHLDLLPVLMRGIAWVRHLDGDQGLVGWVDGAETRQALAPLGASLGRDDRSAEALRVLGAPLALPLAEPAAQHFVLGLPTRENRRGLEASGLAADGFWCLHPEWLADGCLGGVLPDPERLAEQLIELLASGEQATADAVAQIRYAERHRLSDGARQAVRYVDVPDDPRQRIGMASRLRWAAAVAGGLAVLLLGLALGLEWRRRQRRHDDYRHGLASWPLLARRMQRYLDSQHPFQLCWIDFERLDALRDSLSPAELDALLRQIAKRLRDAGQGQGFAASLEGDAFAMMCFLPAPPQDAESTGMAFADHLQQRLSEPLRANDQEWLLLPRIGMARSDASATPLAMLEASRLAARRVAVARQRRPQCHVAQMTAAQDRQLALIESLNAVLAVSEAERERHFSLEVTPTWLLSGGLAGGECRLRWQHPRWGEVDAETLAQLAERCRRQASLDRILVGKVLTALAASGLGAQPALRWALPVAVHHLVAQGLLEWLVASCRARDLAVERLELQPYGLGEHIEPLRLQRAMRRCRDHEIGLVMDGLEHPGHGLAALYRLPYTRLVVEPALLCDVPSDQRAVLLLKGLRDMAHMAGRQCTVRGIDNAEQLSVLKGLGVVAGQGRLYGEATTFETLAEQWRGTQPARGVST
ncbi:hypothetical protein BWR19_07885 [Halomonas sp. 1513]|nr:GGDEF domain-containing protein [Halomonas sp. 1513]APX92856.1 hypothetical protein BWR19_07885 [Halomonas sp. 1513]